jgi:dienelactone hydrolase
MRVRSDEGGILPLRAGMMRVSWNIPPPRGPFAIGTVPIRRSNCREPERWGPNLDWPPAPLIQLWYPAVPSPRGGLFSQGRGGIAYGAPVACASFRFPVLVYFSSWSGIRLTNLALLRELASHGFVVASVLYPSKLAGMAQATYERQLGELMRPMDFSSEEAFEKTRRRADERVRERAEDAIAVLDLLATLPGSETAAGLAQRLDLDHVGIMGFSFGGAVAAEARLLDHRFKAVLNMDGWLFAQAASQGVDCPYMLMSDDAPMPTPAELAAEEPVRRLTAQMNMLDHEHSMSNLRRLGGFLLRILGTGHANFSDDALWWLRPPKQAGSINPVRALQIVNVYAAAFLERYLRGKDSPILNEAVQPFVEAKLESWKCGMTPEVIPAR